MKRYFAFALVLILLLAMAMPAMAAEKQEEYVFSSVTRIPEIISPGKYFFTLSYGGREETCVVSLGYSKHFEKPLFSSYYLDGYNIPIVREIVNPLYDGIRIVERYRDLNNPTNIYSEFCFYSSSLDSIVSADFFTDAEYTLKFVPVTFSNIISMNVFDGVFSQIVAMLPVIFAVIVGFIALRKAINWLFGVLRSS